MRVSFTTGCQNSQADAPLVPLEPKRTVVTDAQGNGSLDYQFEFPGAATSGFLLATATDPAGNTSEFSPCLAVSGHMPPAVQLSQAAYSVSESAGSAAVVVTRTGDASGATLYGGMNNQQYVAALLGRYSLQQVTAPDPANPDGAAKLALTGAELTNRLGAGTLTRAPALRAVADSDEVTAREFDNAFVAMQYYGYLRRKPEQSGFEAWLRVLQSGDVRTMVNGFVISREYKLRFGQP